MINKVKTQNAKLKTKIQKLKFLLLACSFSFFLFPFSFVCFANEITIIYTGDTHAALYHCNCPKEPDGGVSRRDTLIEQLRKEHPEALLLDCGRFFAAGAMDSNAQNTQLDMLRTTLNLKAMELMKYDAVAISDDEFNFGKDFLQNTIFTTKLNFLSCNIQLKKVLPYIIKEVSGIKIGIIGLTSPLPRQKIESQGLAILQSKQAVQEQVAQLKKQGVNLIVLLSQLEDRLGSDSLNDFAGVDIIIGGYMGMKGEVFRKLGDTLILRAYWEGRRLNQVTLKIEDKRIVDFRVDELRVSDKIPDDKNMLSILPSCFSDSNCKKEGFVVFCQNPGLLNAHCVFKKPHPLKLLIITAKNCIACDTEAMINFLKGQFPGILVSYLYYPDKKVEDIIKKFGIFALPVYLLGKDIEREKKFGAVKDNTVLKDNYYMLKPEYSGYSYLLNRQKMKGKLDLFISLYAKDSAKLLDTMKEFNPDIHFLATKDRERFEAAAGNPEVEENLRSVCMQKYYPEHFWDYITCRAKAINSSWWEDCATDLDSDKIKSCAKGEEGKMLLNENIKINQELRVMFGPVFIIDNQEIFGLQEIPSKEEFKKIIDSTKR
jgi:5'-nucleotidase